MLPSRFAHLQEHHNRTESLAAQGTPVVYGTVIQLEHVATGKFVVAQKTLAVTERECYRVQLEAGQEGAWWRVCPAYKFRQAGDPVQFHDVFYLESAKGKTGCLHVSDLPVPGGVGLRMHETYVDAIYEVNCGPEPERLQILPYRDFQSDAGQAPGLVQGGMVVMLHLPECGSCLAPHESREGDLQFVATAQTEIRTSSMWQVEPEAVVWGGMPVELGRRYRLKHLLSSWYLSVRRRDAQSEGPEAAGSPPPEGWGLCLTSDYLTEDCLWVLEGVEGDRRARVYSTTPLYIRHQGGEVWLQEGPSGPACVGQQDPNQYLMLVPASKEAAKDVDNLRAFHLTLADFTKELQGLLAGDSDEDMQSVLKAEEPKVTAVLRECTEMMLGGMPRCRT